MLTEEHLLSFLDVENWENITQKKLEKATKQKPIIAMKHYSFKVTKISFVDNKLLFEGKDLFSGKHREYVFDIENKGKAEKAVIVVYGVYAVIF